MSHNLSKPKLLLDENFQPRIRFPKVNELYDVKHVAEDLRKGGLEDQQVYELAVKLGRIVVTYNVKDFLPFAESSEHSGVIGVSANLTPPQIDTKLVALLRKSSPKQLHKAFNYISGETLT
jgi:predicted nuclease of predicted toxin-antitoxin system